MTISRGFVIMLKNAKIIKQSLLRITFFGGISLENGFANSSNKINELSDIRSCFDNRINVI